MHRRTATAVPVAHPLSIEQNGWRRRQAVQVKFNLKIRAVFIEKFSGFLECIVLSGIRLG